MYWIIQRRHWLAAVGCLAATVIGVVTVCRMQGAVAVVTAAQTGNWGLHFEQNGTTPRANASAEYLKEFHAAYTGDTGRKILYLTFDAGYENGYTAAILDTLKKHAVPAAFFVVGHFAEQNPELIKRMVAEGHTVGNHTYHHPDMSAIGTQEAFAAELRQLETTYREIVGSEMPKFYRPPQGKYSEQNLKMASDMGYKTFFWSLAYVDWYVDDQPTADEAFSKLLPRTHPGAIVLLHSTSRTNCEILDHLLTKWKEMGYTFGELSDV